MVLAFFFFSSDTLLRGIGMGLDIASYTCCIRGGFNFFIKIILKLTKLGHMLHILQIFNVAVLQCVTDVVTCIRRIPVSKTQI